MVEVTASWLHWPSLAVMPPVRISEIHYDNTGADAGEQVEISGPAGTDVTGWKLIPYNGNGGVTYSPTVTFSGTIPATIRGLVDTARTTVTVLTPAQGAEGAIAMVDQLVAAGGLEAGNGNSLKVKLNELDALVRSGRLSVADADALRVLVGRVIASMAA